MFSFVIYINHNLKIKKIKTNRNTFNFTIFGLGLRWSTSVWSTLRFEPGLPNSRPISLTITPLTHWCSLVAFFFLSLAKVCKREKCVNTFPLNKKLIQNTYLVFTFLKISEQWLVTKETSFVFQLVVVARIFRSLCWWSLGWSLFG